MTALFQRALTAEYVILSSAGKHAGEGWRKIIDRKRKDIGNAEHTVWVINSNAARPDMVQSFCLNTNSTDVIFVTRESNIKASASAHSSVEDRGTRRNQKAQRYSPDLKSWHPLDERLTDVTGDIKQSTTGLWLEALEAVSPFYPLDLSTFVSDHDGKTLIGFSNINTAYPARRQAIIVSGRYRILAIGRLAPPFAVWLKAE